MLLQGGTERAFKTVVGAITDIGGTKGRLFDIQTTDQEDSETEYRPSRAKWEEGDEELDFQ